MAHEVWRDVVGYEGYYQVSNLGNVRSVDRCVTCKNGTVKNLRGNDIKLAYNKACGYYYASLTKDNKRRLMSVHRLVAKAFIPNPEGLGYVDHINNVKTDNRASNLRWCTNQQNAIYAKDHVDIGAWKRKPVIRSDGRVFESISAAASEIGKSNSSIYNVVHGNRKTTGGYSFEYIEQEAR